MDSEKLNKAEYLNLLYDHIIEDWQGDYQNELAAKMGWAFDPPPDQWPKQFKSRHFETLRMIAAVELLPMNLEVEIPEAEDEPVVFRFTEEYGGSESE